MYVKQDDGLIDWVPTVTGRQRPNPQEQLALAKLMFPANPRNYKRPDNENQVCVLKERLPKTKTIGVKSSFSLLFVWTCTILFNEVHTCVYVCAHFYLSAGGWESPSESFSQSRDSDQPVWLSAVKSCPDVSQRQNEPVDPNEFPKKRPKRAFELYKLYKLIFIHLGCLCLKGLSRWKDRTVVSKNSPEPESSTCAPQKSFFKGESQWAQPQTTQGTRRKSHNPLLQDSDPPTTSSRTPRRQHCFEQSGDG